MWIFKSFFAQCIHVLYMYSFRMIYVAVCCSYCLVSLYGSSAVQCCLLLHTSYVIKWTCFLLYC